MAIGFWIGSFSAGGAIGPLLGGVMLERFWWGSVFLLALPVMAALLMLGPRVLPEYRDPDAGRLDLRQRGAVGGGGAGGGLRAQGDRPGRGHRGCRVGTIVAGLAVGGGLRRAASGAWPTR